MKKSNKLLLGGFLLLLMFISVIHISLFAKYKAGNYTVYSAQNDFGEQTMQSFPNIAFVSVRHVPGATVRFSSTAAVEKTENSEIQFIQKGDTLLITGKDTTEPRGGYPVVFQVPHNATINVFNSRISFRQGDNIVPNPVLYLANSHAYFATPGKRFELGNLKVTATNHSSISFEGNTHVGQLDVHLLNSALEYAEGDFGRLSLFTDSLSRLSLQSKHLLKADIKTITPE
ncbi:MAG TPA: hypothetical protein VMR70_06665 [Flavisolibacter sp.]|nr:hypothetical protein [Flavisolibacter sp.]